MTPVRRGPGRPRKDRTERSATRHCKLQPDIDDAVCRIAVRRGMNVSAVIRLAVIRLISEENRISGGPNIQADQISS